MSNQLNNKMTDIGSNRLLHEAYAWLKRQCVGDPAHGSCGHALSTGQPFAQCCACNRWWGTAPDAVREKGDPIDNNWSVFTCEGTYCKNNYNPSTHFIGSSAFKKQLKKVD